MAQNNGEKVEISRQVPISNNTFHQIVNNREELSLTRCVPCSLYGDNTYNIPTCNGAVEVEIRTSMTRKRKVLNSAPLGRSDDFLCLAR